MTRLRRVAVAGCLGLLAACNGVTAPLAGSLQVKLATPNNGQDGAALLALTLPVVPSGVTAAPGLTLWGPAGQGNAVRLVLTGTLTSGTILTLQVEDVNKVHQYGVTLVQVATMNTQLRTSLAGYSVTIIK